MIKSITVVKPKHIKDKKEKSLKKWFSKSSKAFHNNDSNNVQYIQEKPPHNQNKIMKKYHNHS